MIREIGPVGADWGRSASTGVAGDNVGARGSSRRGWAVRDQAIGIRLLDPFVDDGATPVLIHVRSEDGGLVAKIPRVGHVASSLGEEERDVVAGGVGLEVDIAGHLEGAITAPLIRVQTEEVGALSIAGAASQVVLQVGTQLGNVCTRISYQEVPVALAVAVGLHVAHSGFDVGGSGAVSARVEHFVTDEEAGDVVIARESVHDSGIGVVLALGPVRVSADDVGGESVKVNPSVNASGGEGGHAAVVVGRGIDMVDTDRVRADGLHEGSIALALVGVGKRVAVGKLVGDA